MKKLLFVTAIAMLVVSMAGIAQDRAEFEERIKLELYLIDIVVVDEQGNYVNGLTADDFEIYEDGKAVKVVSVDEYFSQQRQSAEDMAMGAMEESSAPPRNIIIVLDRFFSSSYAIKQGKMAVSEFIRESLLPTDRVMLLTYDNRFAVQQDFTSNHGQLLARVDSITAATRSLYTPEFKSGITSQADSAINLSSINTSNSDIETAAVDKFHNVRFEQDVRNFHNNIRQLSTALKAVPGKKTVILLSEGYDSRIINDNRGSFSQNLRSSNQIVRDEYIGSSGTGGGSGTGPTLFASYNDAISKINDASTSFYIIDIASLESQISRTDSFELRSATKDNEFDTARLNSLNSLADNTGGRLYKNIKNLDRVVAEIDYDISNYYMLGYQSNNTSKEGDFREIRVEAKLPGLEVRHRKGFFERKPFNRMRDSEQFVHLVEGFFRTEPENELPGQTSIFFLPIQADTFVASLCLNIPASSLPGKGEKTLEMLGQILDGSNQRIDAFHKVLNYSSSMAQITAEGELRVTVPFVLKTGKNKVQVIVRNNNTGDRLYFFKEYNLPAGSPDELTMSSLALIDPSKPHSSTHNHKMEIINKGRDTGYEGFRVIDPLQASVGTPVFPMVDPVIKSGGKTIAFFSAANYWQDETTKSVNFYIDFVLVDLEGNETRLNVSDEKFLPVPGTRRLNVLSELDFTGVEPGFYDLVVRFLDKELVQGIKRTVQLTVE
jgi:VWFA-related protein